MVQLVHGMCEHKERYAGFMEFLAGKGFVSVIHDHRGHGESVGTAADLGHFMEGGWNGLVEDVRKVTQLAQREYPELPVVLFGHSMGSLAVRACVRRSDEGYAGLVVCGSPSLNSGVGAAKVLGKAFAAVAGDRHRPALLENLTFGSFNRRFRGEKSPHAWICTDPEVVRRYDADPLCNFRFTLNGIIGHTVLGSKAWIKRKPSDIYWNGVKTLGFFNSKSPLIQNLSLREYLGRSLAMTQAKDIKSLGSKNVGIEGEMDDLISLGAGYNKFWNMPKPDPGWLNDLRIDLTAEEADFFRKAIIRQYPDSVFSVLLNTWDKGSARLGYLQVMDKVFQHVEESTRELLRLAKKFDAFVFSARACYNVIWSDKANIEAMSAWEECSHRLSEIADIDLKHMMEMLKIKQPRTLRFLCRLRQAYKENADFGEIRQILTDREIDIKGRSRAKLLRPSTENAQWIGGGHLEYRSYNACQLIIDIYGHV